MRQQGVFEFRPAVHGDSQQRSKLLLFATTNFDQQSSSAGAVGLGSSSGICSHTGRCASTSAAEAESDTAAGCLASSLPPVAALAAARCANNEADARY